MNTMTLNRTLSTAESGLLRNTVNNIAAYLSRKSSTASRTLHWSVTRAHLLMLAASVPLYLTFGWTLATGEHLTALLSAVLAARMSYPAIKAYYSQEGGEA